jgi:hypothetical protein
MVLCAATEYRHTLESKASPSGDTLRVGVCINASLGTAGYAGKESGRLHPQPNVCHVAFRFAWHNVMQVKDRASKYSGYALA